MPTRTKNSEKTGGHIDWTTDNQYTMLEFEWDQNKADANLFKHGVAFQHAVKAFNDHFAIELIDDRKDYGEERITLIGMCDGILLHVTYTDRGERIRIISARRAVKHEQEYYYHENSF